MAPQPPPSSRPGTAWARLDRVAVALATVGGVGWAPVAPGTVASALTAVVLWIVPFSRAGLVVGFVAVAVIGTWAAQHAERALGAKDPGAIVIDEVAGMTLAVLLLPLTPPVLALAFLLFRLFDIVKPTPARQAQALPGGVGVMVDDLVAGLYALVIVAALRALVGWP
jgi:phosphatidylglycerophosphatase A